MRAERLAQGSQHVGVGAQVGEGGLLLTQCVALGPLTDIP